MARTAIISVDGHVRGSRAGYRDYIQSKYLEIYDKKVKKAEELGIPDAGNMNPDAGIEVQWDSALRMERLESVGVVGEVVFPNGVPFQTNPFDDFARGSDPELLAEGRRAYNRWLVDFCAESSGRVKGMMSMDFTDVDEAVADVYWAKEHGLGGINLPGMNHRDRFFFDPELDPIWAAIEETGLPVTQHGGAGLPQYQPAGFAVIMMLVAEQGFFSCRSLWMLICGGVFDRFPGLRVSYVETQVHFITAVLAQLDMALDPDNDWLGFAQMMGRERIFERKPSDYIGTNAFIGLSPFTPLQIPLDELVGKDADQQPLPGFHFGADATMFGVDYPHFESIHDRCLGEVATLVTTPGVSEADARKILLMNAAEMFDFDLDALQPHIDRVGFEISEVVARADEYKEGMAEIDTPFKNEGNILTDLAKK